MLLDRSRLVTKPLWVVTPAHSAMGRSPSQSTLAAAFQLELPVALYTAASTCRSPALAGIAGVAGSGSATDGSCYPTRP